MDPDHPADLPQPLELRDVPEDRRLYVPYPDGWTVHIKTDGFREYCHFKAPGEDYFHLLLQGEIHLQYNDAKFCLNCASRYAHVTDDRLFWQNGVRRHRDPLV